MTTLASLITAASNNKEKFLQKAVWQTYLTLHLLNQNIVQDYCTAVLNQKLLESC